MIDLKVNQNTGVVEAWSDGKYLCDVDELGEENSIRGDAVEAFRRRRKKRLDGKAVDEYKERRASRRQMRNDAEEPAGWITVNGNHIPVNEAGEAIGGQPKALGEGGGKPSEKSASSDMGRIKHSESVQSIAKANQRLKEMRATLNTLNKKWKELADERAWAEADELMKKMKEYQAQQDVVYEERKAEIEKMAQDGVWDGIEKRINSVFDGKSSVSLRGMDYDLAEDTAKAFEDVFSKYPTLKESVKAVTLRDSTPAVLGDNTIASFDMSSGELFLSTDFFGIGNKEAAIESYAKDVENQFHPAGTNLMSSVYHEIGHAFDAYISRELFGYKYTWQGESVSRRLWNNEINAAKRRGEPLNGKSMREMLSGYAGKSPAEYLAEGFSEYMTSASPRPAAVRTGKMIEKYIKKLEARK